MNKRTAFMIIFLIGLIIILDGVLSIVFQLEEDFLFQLGRVIRISLGLFLIFIIWKIYKKG